jgi:hypothetical protein
LGPLKGKIKTHITATSKNLSHKKTQNKAQKRTQPQKNTPTQKHTHTHPHIHKKNTYTHKDTHKLSSSNKSNIKIKEKYINSKEQLEIHTQLN